MLPRCTGWDLAGGAGPAAGSGPGGFERGAQGYFNRSPEELAELLRLRVVALLGRDVRIGVAGTRAAAAMASARVPGSGGVLLVEPGQERRFMEPLPVGALDGIGPKQAATLERFGLTTVGQLAATPSATVERILGRKAAGWRRSAPAGWTCAGWCRRAFRRAGRCATASTGTSSTARWCGPPCSSWRSN